MAKTPLGRLDPRAFGMLELPRLARDILDVPSGIAGEPALKPVVAE